METNDRDYMFVMSDDSKDRTKHLSRVGMNTKMMRSNFKAEKLYNSLTPNVLVRTASEEKARDIAARLEKNNKSYDMVLGFHTVAVLNNKIIRKPSNRDEALSIMKLLNGRTHSVITGVTLFHSSEVFETFAVETKVKFIDAPEEMLVQYVKCDEWIDQIAAYNIRQKGSAFIESINGCFFNVMGVPVSSVFNKAYKIMFDIKESAETERIGNVDPRSKSPVSPPKVQSSNHSIESSVTLRNSGSTAREDRDDASTNDRSMGEEEHSIYSSQSEASIDQETLSNEDSSATSSTGYEQTSSVASQSSESVLSGATVTTQYSNASSTPANSNRSSVPTLMRGNPRPLPSTPRVQQNAAVSSRQSIEPSATPVAIEFSPPERCGVRLITPRYARGAVHSGRGTSNASNLQFFNQRAGRSNGEGSEVGESAFNISDQADNNNNTVMGIQAAATSSRGPKKESESVESTTAPVISQNSNCGNSGETNNSFRGDLSRGGGVRRPIQGQSINEGSSAAAAVTPSIANQSSTLSIRGNSFPSIRGGFALSRGTSRNGETQSKLSVFVDPTRDDNETEGQAAMPSNEIQSVNSRNLNASFENALSANPPATCRKRFFNKPTTVEPPPPSLQVSSTCSLQSAATESSTLPATTPAAASKEEGSPPTLKVIRDANSSTFFRATGVPGYYDLRRAGIEPPKPAFNPKHSYKYSDMDDWG